jgi:hypothetical protein
MIFIGIGAYITILLVIHITEGSNKPPQKGITQSGSCGISFPNISNITKISFS